MKLKYILIFLYVAFFSTILQANYEKSVVRISSILSLYDYKKPWEVAHRKNVVGSGVIIKNQYILTNAHVVSSAKVVEIKKIDDKKRYYAKVKYISYQADLALLEMYDKNFFKDTKSLNITLQTDKKEEVFAVGYPQGGIKLISTKGKIKKFKYEPYSLSNESLPVLELGISISEGNSGGPILNKHGEIIGIAMQMPKDSSNKAYAISAFIINSFLEDIKDKKVDGFYSSSNFYQFLENKTLQDYYNTHKKSILVRSIDMDEKQLKVNDIIFRVEEKEILGKKNFLLNLHKKPVNQRIGLSILRDKKVLNINYKLYNSKKLIQQEYDKKPRYFIFAGLVFTPITRNYLQKIGMTQYEINMLFYEQKRSIKMQELVAWMETKFKDSINKGYNSKVEIVHMVNGIKVKSFKHFKKLIEKSSKKYIIINFLNNQQIVLKKDEALKSFAKIQKQYKL